MLLRIFVRYFLAVSLLLVVGLTWAVNYLPISGMSACLGPRGVLNFPATTAGFTIHGKFYLAESYDSSYKWGKFGPPALYLRRQQGAWHYVPSTNLDLEPTGGSQVVRYTITVDQPISPLERGQVMVLLPGKVANVFQVSGISKGYPDPNPNGSASGNLPGITVPITYRPLLWATTEPFIGSTYSDTFNLAQPYEGWGSDHPAAFTLTGSRALPWNWHPWKTEVTPIYLETSPPTPTTNVRVTLVSSVLPNLTSEKLLGIALRGTSLIGYKETSLIFRGEKDVVNEPIKVRPAWAD